MPVVELVGGRPCGHPRAGARGRGGAARRRGRPCTDPRRRRRTSGLPPGSTSNWFRTRRALLGGIVDWIAERERADFDPTGVPAMTGVEGLIGAFCAVVELRTGPFAARTRARYALFLELAGDTELAAPLRRQRHEFERWTEQIVTDVGITDPVPATRALMALADGLLLHRLTVDPTIEVRPAIERAVRALAG